MRVIVKYTTRQKTTARILLKKVKKIELSCIDNIEGYEVRSESGCDFFTLESLDYILMEKEEN